MFCEWTIGEKSYVCLADYPPITIETMKEGLVLTGAQSAHWKTPASARELMDKIPMATPLSQATIPVEGLPGYYSYDQAALEGIARMDWRTHFELGKQAASGEWKPAPQVAQVPAQLPGPDVLTPARQRAIRELAGNDLPALALPQAPAISGTTGPVPTTPLGVQAMAVAQADMTLPKAQEVMQTHTYAGRAATEPELHAAWAVCRRDIYETQDAAATARPVLSIAGPIPAHPAEAASSSSSGAPRQ